MRTPSLVTAIVPVLGLAALGLAACSKTDTAPPPEHNPVATSMPDAASTPGAVGPGAAAPPDTPPAATTLSDTHPQPGGAPATAPTGPSPSANPADHPQ
jgi:hypothetical protein